jgi:MFS family permease
MPVLFLCVFACYVVSFALLFALPPVGGPGMGHPETDPTAAATGQADPAHPAAEGGNRPRQVYRAILPVFAIFAAFTALANAATYVSLYLQDTQGLQLSSLGWFGSAASIGGFICAPLIGRLRDRRGGDVAMQSALVLAAAGYGALLTIRNRIFLFGALMLRGGESAGFALSNVEVAARAPREGMGRVFASYQVLTGIGATVGPYLGGLLYELDIRLPFVTLIAGYLALALAARSVLRPLAQPAAGTLYSSSHTNGGVPDER